MAKKKLDTYRQLDALSGMDDEAIARMRDAWNNGPARAAGDFDEIVASQLRDREQEQRLDEAAERSRKELMKGTRCLNTFLVGALVLAIVLA
jgi:hypothetical protein